MSGAGHKGAIDAPTAEAQVARIFEWRRGFNAMHLIDLGVRLGLFKAFAETPGATPGQVAAALNLHPPYVENWCMTGYSFGLLEAGEDAGFRLAPFMDKILANPGHPRYMGGYVRLGTEFATEDHRFCLEAFGPARRFLFRAAARRLPRVRPGRRSCPRKSCCRNCPDCKSGSIPAVRSSKSVAGRDGTLFYWPRRSHRLVASVWTSTRPA